MPTKTETDNLRKELVALLRQGEQGVLAWSARLKADAAGMDYRESDLSKLDLPGINMRNLRFKNCDFSQSNLFAAFFCSSDLTGCNFVEAKCEGTNFYQAKLQNANFSNACLRNASLKNTKLNNAMFSGADLTIAKLWQADLRGADLASSNLSDAQLHQAVYDEHTRLPIALSDEQWKLMRYKGSIPDPYKEARKQQHCDTGSLDYAGFIKQIQNNFDNQRIQKALSMLKKEIFQLYSDANDDFVIGIIKSQTDAEMAYCARLDRQGRFACCSNKLNPCGGLRGALCKHLLVLIIGLTRAGRLDPTHAAHWVLASRQENPEPTDEIKQGMAEAFLKFKGAEAGQIDWRPTETVPEDYYAY